MSKHDLSLVPPVINAAGSLGFTPDLHRSLDWTQLGAFITNPISLQPRTPAHGTRYRDYPGGFLLHTGYPNPGLKQALRQHARHWLHAPVPVIVHLLGGSPGELSEMVRRIENIEGVSGLEVGFPYEADISMLTACLQAASGELPLIAHLPPERAEVLAPLAIQAGAAIVSRSAPRGLLPIPGGDLVQGRLFGPAVFPVALKAVSILAHLGIPTIGRGGVYTQEHVQAMQKAGAVAVQLDSALWREAGQRILT